LQDIQRDIQKELSSISGSILFGFIFSTVAFGGGVFAVGDGPGEAFGGPARVGRSCGHIRNLNSVNIWGKL